MENKKYKQFKEIYLKKFRTYYNKENSNKKEIKRSIFENPKLSEDQKIDFWELVKEDYYVCS